LLSAPQTSAGIGNAEPSEGYSLKEATQGGPLLQDQDQTEWMMDTATDGLSPFNLTDALGEDAACPLIQGLEDPESPTESVHDLVVSRRPYQASSSLSDRHLSLTIADRYASEYFSNAHPMWPFIHQTQWDDSWSSWKSPGQVHDTEHGWTLFFADMVRLGVDS
jgi:hypothetical protein